jgi:hypothetical protein
LSLLLALTLAPGVFATDESEGPVQNLTVGSQLGDFKAKTSWGEALFEVWLTGTPQSEFSHFAKDNGLEVIKAPGTGAPEDLMGFVGEITWGWAMPQGESTDTDTVESAVSVFGMLRISSEAGVPAGDYVFKINRDGIVSNEFTVTVTEPQSSGSGASLTVKDPQSEIPAPGLWKDSVTYDVTTAGIPQLDRHELTPGGGLWGAEGTTNAEIKNLHAWLTTDGNGKGTLTIDSEGAGMPEGIYRLKLEIAWWTEIDPGVSYPKSYPKWSNAFALIVDDVENTGSASLTVIDPQSKELAEYTTGTVTYDVETVGIPQLTRHELTPGGGLWDAQDGTNAKIANLHAWLTTDGSGGGILEIDSENGGVSAGTYKLKIERSGWTETPDTPYPKWSNEFTLTVDETEGPDPDPDPVISVTVTDTQNGELESGEFGTSTYAVKTVGVPQLLDRELTHGAGLRGSGETKDSDIASLQGWLTTQNNGDGILTIYSNYTPAGAYKIKIDLGWPDDPQYWSNEFTLTVRGDTNPSASLTVIDPQSQALAEYTTGTVTYNVETVGIPQLTRHELTPGGGLWDAQDSTNAKIANLHAWLTTDGKGSGILEIDSENGGMSAGTYKLKIERSGWTETPDTPYPKWSNEFTLTVTPRGSGGSSNNNNNNNQTSSASAGATSVNYTQSGGAVKILIPDGKANEVVTNSDDIVIIDLSGAANATSATLPKTALAKFSDADLPFEIKLPQGSVTFGVEAAKSACDQAGGSEVSVELKAAAASSLNARQRAAVGDAPVYDISVSSNDGKRITDFGGNPVTISLPYTLKPGEKVAGVVVWYVDGNGNIQKMDTMYDVRTKTVIFSTDHLSLYAINYDAEAAEAAETNEAAEAWGGVNRFTDVSAEDWFFEDVEYALANGLFNGTSTTTFEPNGAMTRGMFVTVLGRLSGADAVAYKTKGFDDVDDGLYYATYAEWAKENKIVNGVGDNKFAPDAKITRQDLAVVIMNYGKFANRQFPVTPNRNTFADEADIADYAKEALQTLYAGGLVNGKPGNLLDPTGTATRAEVAAILHRYAKNTE